ncbi:putative epoxide hydrolase [Cladorrhinum sp. PSN259]|nr:putative epoxide hydrolase [Cladorrhinum sp. PSN259]
MALNLSAFGVLPAGLAVAPTPFTLSVPNRDVHTLYSLVDSAYIAAPGYYNTHAYAPNGTFGISRDWLIDSKNHWIDDYDWREAEAYQNSFPQWKLNVTTPSDGQLWSLHFVGLFSQKTDAIPITFLHGWPGSWLEFAGVVELLAAKYTPETLPYHVIVPSIPDYAESTRLEEVETEIDMNQAGEALNELMKGLGFDSYVAQGGDVGSFLSLTMCGNHDECKAYHLNMYFMTPEQSAAVANISINEEERKRQDDAAAWGKTGSAYANEHGTRPSTISLVLNTNPMAMLAWMGEKFIEWSDNVKSEPLSLDTIISMVSLYWFTDTYVRSMWSYRVLTSIVGGSPPTMPTSYTKPFGYSAFRTEIATFPRPWAEYLFPNNLVFFKSHDKGGHFAALQEPALFLEDIEAFLALDVVKGNITASA